MKYDYTQLSNLSVDYISEKDVLEAIYTRMFEEKQQARKVKRDSAGGVVCQQSVPHQHYWSSEISSSE